MEVCSVDQLMFDIWAEVAPKHFLGNGMQTKICQPSPKFCL